MSRRKSTSIRRKLQAIILATAGSSLLLSLIMIMVMEIGTAKSESETRLRSLAKVIGANSRATIIFLDQGAATEILATLETQKDVLRVQLMDAKGKLFAQYLSPIEEQTNNNKAGFFNQNLSVIEVINLNGENIGSILIEGDMSGVRKTLIKQGIIGLAVLFVAMILAFFISSKLQKIISKPINNLLATMVGVAKKQDFSQRAERLGNDELGLLADGFNNMLEHIQKHDKELTLYRDNLESLVDERTHELAEKNNELTRVSRTDWLTGLNNRLRLDEILEQELSRSTRYKVPFSVILLDIDKFKHINDNYGHDVGDKTLIAFATILSSHVRDSDFVGRWGGDEFLVICPETDQEGVVKLAENIREQVVAYNFKVIGNSSSSFGTSTFQVGDKIDTMIKRADKALLYVKKSGRNQVENGELIS
jgi:diguanylate cyclase (GGDEF)-like protein